MPRKPPNAQKYWFKGLSRSRAVNRCRSPAAAEAHRLGLHVHGHMPVGTWPLDAMRADYDEVTHINFIMMQAMPQEVVHKANTAARLEGPVRYGKDMDLVSPAMKAFYSELAARHTIVDPTLTVWEPLLTSDGSVISPEYAPFTEIAPPSVTRGWKIGCYPLFGGPTRHDFRKSFAKMVGLVGRLHQAGGTDRCWHQRLGARGSNWCASSSALNKLTSATPQPCRLQRSSPHG